MTKSNKNSILRFNREPVLTSEHVQSLRDNDRKHPSGRFFAAQEGAQERMLSQDADIMICGGNRGGSKSFTLLLEALYDIENPNFSAMLLRNEKPDLESLIRDSRMLYSQFGEYHVANNDMAWHLNNGGKIGMWFYSGDFANKFQKKFQGQQYAYIGIDEITHCPYNKFKYLLTCNRNAHNIRNRFIGTCNPDPDSWVRKFIDWWIGEDGYPIPERDCKKRYCFMDGETVDTIYWGDTREEVYEQCKDIIDNLWSKSSKEYEANGLNKLEVFTTSVVFVRASLEENKKLLLSDPSYAARLAQQSDEQRERDLNGNWNFKAAGDDVLKTFHMEAFYKNGHQHGDGKRRATCDVALDGGDQCVLWLLVGDHLEDVVTFKMDAKKTLHAIQLQLNKWGVREEDFAYDGAGIGKFLDGFMPQAQIFQNQGTPVKDGNLTQEIAKMSYRYLKDQCADKFAMAVKNLELSINPEILDKRFSGKGYRNVPLSQILMRERKALRWQEKADRYQLIVKDDAKKLVGHSPDFLESLYFTQFFKLQTKHRKARGLWMM